MDAAGRIREIRNWAKRQQLVVLVWGPGDPGPKGSPEIRAYWDKRNQIKEILIKELPGSEVYFWESDALRDHTRDLESLITEELVHARIADCIIVIDVSRGAHVEVDRFSAYPLIASKIRLLIPGEYAGGTGLVSEVHKAVKVRGFTNEQLQKCVVATEMSVSIVTSVAIEKYMASGGLPPM